jgi:hypothetical protein
MHLKNDFLIRCGLDQVLFDYAQPVLSDPILNYLLNNDHLVLVNQYLHALSNSAPTLVSHLSSNVTLLQQRYETYRFGHTGPIKLMHQCYRPCVLTVISSISGRNIVIDPPEYSANTLVLPYEDAFSASLLPRFDPNIRFIDQRDRAFIDHPYLVLANCFFDYYQDYDPNRLNQLAYLVAHTDIHQEIVFIEDVISANPSNPLAQLFSPFCQPRALFDLTTLGSFFTLCDSLFNHFQPISIDFLFRFANGRVSRREFYQAQALFSDLDHYPSAHSFIETEDSGAIPYEL